jgi:hypothetical protein
VCEMREYSRTQGTRPIVDGLWTAVCLQQPRELRVAVRHVERRDARRIGAADRVAALIEVREGGDDVGECEEPRVDVDQLLQPITLRALKCTVASAKYELC